MITGLKIAKSADKRIFDAMQSLAMPFERESRFGPKSTLFATKWFKLRVQLHMLLEVHFMFVEFCAHWAPFLPHHDLQSRFILPSMEL